MELKDLNLKEKLYILAALLLVGLKAFGLEESSFIFRIIMIVSFCIIFLKMTMDDYSIIEILIITGSLIYGVHAFFTMGSLGLIILVMLMVGMKGISIKHLFSYLCIEYIFAFFITICLNLLLGYNAEGPFAILEHEKFGINVVRRSLGYAHPNVLHITYVVLMCLILFCSDKHGKKLYALLIRLFVLNIVIFFFSWSSTGMLMSLLLTLLSFFYERICCSGKYICVKKILVKFVYVFVTFAFWGFIFFSLGIMQLLRLGLISNDTYEFFDYFFNARVLAVTVYYEYTGLSIFGKYLNNMGGWGLDCSYAYALYAYGVCFLVLAFLAYMFTIRFLINNRDYKGVLIICVLLFGGISEPFLFNSSIKNLGVFFIGEWIFSNFALDEIHEWNLYELRWKLREIYFHKILRQHIFEKYFHVNIVMPRYAKRRVYNTKDTNSWIIGKIQSGEPFMVSRFGNTELQTTVSVLKIKYQGKTSDNMTRYKKWFERINLYSGFFPLDEKNIERFSEVIIDSCQATDMLAMWHCNMEDYMINKYIPDCKLTYLTRIEPWNAEKPWTCALKGKKVLVIHPFEDSIREQYEKRKFLFDNPDILPDFELYTIKAVQTIAGTNDARFEDWFEALDYMYNAAMSIDFDIAIIGCGAYGMPLAAKLKRAGKQAIHMGGVTQVLFGIKGRRWIEDPCFKLAFNDYWKFPETSETPQQSNVVEGNCYWK